MDNVWCQLLNRRQNHLVLILININSAFPPQQLLEEKATGDLWINCHDVLLYFGGQNGGDLSLGSHVKFIWSSEESGFRHLYLHQVQLTDSNNPLSFSLPSPSLSSLATNDNFNTLPNASTMSSSAKVEVVNCHGYPMSGHSDVRCYGDNLAEHSYSSATTYSTTTENVLANGKAQFLVKQTRY